MARNVSLSAIQASLAQQTSEVYLILLQIDHVSLGTPLRFVNNNENITSNSNEYTAFPFEAVMPDDQDSKEPTAEIRIDNVSRQLIDEIRSIQTPPTITLSVILASSPDTVEWGPLEFLTRGVFYDAGRIVIRLSYSVFAREPFPYIAFDQSNFPGMFS